jgi:hypothetical protein
VQARQGYIHLPRLGRPAYRAASESKAKRRLVQTIEKQKLMAARRSKRK